MTGSEPQQVINLAKEICTYLVHAFGHGTLTTTGAQYGSSGVSTSTGDWTVVETKTIQPFIEGFGNEGTIIELEFGLTTSAMNDSASTGARVTYNWQAKNLASTSTEDWVWLLPTSSGHSTAVGSTAAESTYSGYMTVTGATLNKVPLQIRLLVMGGQGSTDGASATGSYARAKNSTYIKAIYRIS